MSVPSALFAKLYMSGEMCGKWLSSPVKFVGDYGDWREMNPAAARTFDEWGASAGRGEFESVGEFLDGVADCSRYFRGWYDEEEAAFFIADAKHRSGVIEIAASVAALRGAEEFADAGRPGFIYVFPAASGGDPEALLRIERGSSRFLSPGDSSPETLYFVSEAEEFIETILEDGDITSCES